MGPWGVLNLCLYLWRRGRDPSGPPLEAGLQRKKRNYPMVVDMGVTTVL